MNKWYENEELLKATLACDKAFFDKDIAEMRKLSDKCYHEGHNPDNSIIVQAKYMYSSFTSLSDWMEASVAKDLEEGIYKTKLDAMRAYEPDYEKSYYLVRTAFDLCNEYIATEEKLTDLDRAYFHGFYLSMLVNYANVLSQTGRLIKSIEVLNAYSNADFPMLLGNLGLKYIDFSSFDYDS